MSGHTFAIILFSISLSAAAQYVLKLAASSPDVQSAMAAGAKTAAFAIGLAPLVWIGLFMYGVGFIAWIFVLSRVDLSVAYPFVGLSFIFTLLIGAFVLGETVTVGRAAGVLLIAAGCVLVARSA